MKASEKALRRIIREEYESIQEVFLDAEPEVGSTRAERSDSWYQEVDQIIQMVVREVSDRVSKYGDRNVGIDHQGGKHGQMLRDVAEGIKERT